MCLNAEALHFSYCTVLRLPMNKIKFNRQHKIIIIMQLNKLALKINGKSKVEIVAYVH